jgi:hypothetical protein
MDDKRICIDDGLSPEELAAEIAEALPERAAMSTVSMTGLDAATGMVEAVSDGVSESAAATADPDVTTTAAPEPVESAPAETTAAAPEPVETAEPVEAAGPADPAAAAGREPRPRAKRQPAPAADGDTRTEASS